MSPNAPNGKSAPKNLPKYQQLAQQLRSRIESGDLRPGERMSSFAEMRGQFGLTNNTIEKIYDLLARDGLITREPKRGIFVAQPVVSEHKIVSQSQRTARSGMIGLAGFGFRYAGLSSYWARLLAGMQEAANTAGQQLLLLGDNPPYGWEQADGVILCDWSGTEISRYVPPQMPCVSLLVASSSVASVAIDEFQGAHQVTQHLLKSGHRRIAYLSGNDPTVSLQRAAGFHDAMKKARLKVLSHQQRSITGENDHGLHFIEAGNRAMQQWINEGWSTLNCTALICHNDEIAVGALGALREAGIAVPGEVSVVGFDGLEIGVCTVPPLTTVEIPLREAGARAVEMLLRQIQSDQIMVEHQILSTQLRVRKSSGRVPHN